MAENQITFDDGAAYERYMGIWSQRAGEAFLDWLAPTAGGRWLDVGCGNGAFTEMLLTRSAAGAVDGVDPSEAQLAFARSRPTLREARFQSGDAMALPFPADTFDAAVMPLVIFFVPEPSRGVAEMARVVRPGGVVSAYAWDIPGGGFPYEILWDEMRSAGIEVPLPPSPDATRIDVLHGLWADAGLKHVETRELTASRTFADFDDYWATVRGGPSVGKGISAMPETDRERLKSRLRERLGVSSGPIVCTARANAVKGIR